MRNINYPVLLSAAFGGFIAVIIDLLTNNNAAITLKIKDVLLRNLEWMINGGWIILGIVVIPAVVCAILETSSKKEGLMTGLSVFAFLNVATPYSGTIGQETIPVSPSVMVNDEVNERFQFTSYTIDKKTGAPQLEANATIIKNEWVSSCKPSYSGVLGIQSLVNNSIDYCPTGDILAPNERVRIIDQWDTNLRSYRYVEVRYLRDGVLKAGWIWSGQGPDFWMFVMPDNYK